MSLGEGSERDAIGKKINGINAQLKSLDATIGNHQRNVGNYKEAFVGAFQSMGGATKNLIPPINTLDKSLKGLAKNPALLAVAALTAAIGGLVKGFKSSEENMNKLKTAFSGFAAIGDFITGIFQKLAEWIGNASIALVNFLDKLGLLGPKFKERQRIAEENIKLIQKERDQLVKSAKVEADVADLRAKAADEDKYSYQERINYLNEAQQKELANLEVEKEILAAKIAQLSAITSINQASTEQLDQLASLQAEMARLEGTISNTTRQYTKEVNNLKKQAVAAKRQETETLLNLQKDLLQQEYDLEKQGSERQLQLAKEIAKKDYEIEKAGLEAKFKNKEQRRKAEKLALQKYQAEVEKLEREHQENLFEIQLQKQNDVFDKQIALATNKYEALKKEWSKLQSTYEAINERGRESGQTQENFDLQVTQLRNDIREKFIEMVNEFNNYAEQAAERGAKTYFRDYGEQTFNYYAELVKQYSDLVKKFEDNYKVFSTFTTKMEGEDEKKYQEYKLRTEEAFQKNILELKKKYFDAYFKYARTWSLDREVLAQMDEIEKVKDYLDGMPHTVWGYIFGPSEKEMWEFDDQVQQAQLKLKMYIPVINNIMKQLWEELNPGKEFNIAEHFHEAFQLLPDDIKNEYLSTLSDLKDAEQELLAQRYENWNGFTSAVGDLFGNVGDAWESILKLQVKNGKKSEEQAKKEFANIKKLQLAQVVINTLAGSVGAFLQASQTYPAPYGQIIGGVAMASAIAAGVAQYAKIQATDFGGSSSSISSSSPQATPIVDMYQPEYTRNITTASDVETLNAGLERANLVVHVSEIDSVQERGRVRVSESSF